MKKNLLYLLTTVLSVTLLVFSREEIKTSAQIVLSPLGVTLPVSVINGGTGTASTLTGLVRGSSSAFTAAELSGDATTSGSNVVTVAKVNGVSFSSSPSTDTLAVITAANTATYKALADCQDSSGNHLNYTASTHAFSCGTSAGSSWPYTYTAKTANYTAVAFDDIDCTANSFTITLPASSANANKGVIVTNSGSGIITVARTGSDVIGNQAETGQTLNPGDSRWFNASGTSLWRIH